MTHTLVVMGVAGAGKTVIGRQLAAALGWRFVDADAFHSDANVEKMRRGIGLTDADREPWLARLHEDVIATSSRQDPVVLACSCLKDRYRQTLTRGRDDVRFVYLHATPELIARRLASRQGHYAGAALIDSQFRELEEPADAITVEASGTPLEIVAALVTALKTRVDLP